MSFTPLETSRTLGKPVSLYLFRYGPNSGDIYAYTDATEVITFGGHDFLPVAIDRDAVTASGTLDKSQMTVTTSADVDVLDLFAGWPPSVVVTLVIYQGHADDTDFRVTWSGRVVSVERPGSEMSFGAQPVTTALNRIGLTRNWQYGCPHTLYEQGDYLCNANKAAATVTASVTSVTSPSIGLPNGWNGAKTINRFLNGTCAWTDTNGRPHIRNIMAINGTTGIRLSGEATGMVVGTSVSLSLGCRHDTSDCLSVHNNIQNYGGDPWIPLDNPIGIKNNFY